MATREIPGAEHEPSAGVAAGLRAPAAVMELLQARGAPAQLCVIRDGKVVMDVSVGCARDSLFWIFSASKPYLAVVIHQLAESGAVSLDDPVAAYWPVFARRGKERVTVRQVLQHRSGLPVHHLGLREAVTLTDWDRSTRRVAARRLSDPPGAVPVYQPLDYGFILGEVARRATGTPVRDLLRANVLDVLGAADTHLGLSAEHWPRHVPVRVTVPGGGALAALVNRPATRAAVVPAAGISTTARDLAAFYLMLLRAGDTPGRRVLGAEALAAALRPSSDGQVDRSSGLTTRWSEGFQLGGPRFVHGEATPFGALSSPGAFGHNGSGCCIGWADPDRDLAVAYLTGRIEGRQADTRHQSAVADAILTAFGG